MSTLLASFAPPQLSVRAPSDRALMMLLIGLCAFSAALGRFCFLLRPFDNDAAIFIYMGHMVDAGGRMCHDLIDNKFPTVGLMMLLPRRLFGTCWPAYICLQALLSVATAFSLGRSASRVVGAHAQVPTTLFALVFLNFTTAVFGGFQLETVQVFFISLAAGACIEMIANGQASDGFVAGLTAGVGAMCKPTAISVLLAFLAAIIVSHFLNSPDRKARDRTPGNTFRRSIPGLPAWAVKCLCAMLLGLSIPAATALLYLQSADLLGDMPALYHQISNYARQSVFDVVELIKPLTALLLLGFPMLVRGYVFRRSVDPQQQSPRPAITLFLLLWLTIETTGVILQRRMYAYHFLPMVPPAALLFGMLPRLNRPNILAASLLPIAFLSITQASNLIATTKPGEARLPISDYLATHAQPGDAVWMDAWPRVILETGLRPASRLPFSFLFTNYDTAGLDYSAGMIADFERTRPAFIILPVPLDRRLQYQIDFIPELNRRPIRRASYIAGWHRIQQYTLDHYDQVTLIGNDAVYRRRLK